MQTGGRAGRHTEHLGHLLAEMQFCSGPIRGRHGSDRPAGARPAAAAASVPDPEIPALTIADLGMLRDVALRADAVEVAITPSYLGCPAMLPIAQDVVTALAAAGFPDARRAHRAGAGLDAPTG